jgi:LytR cell envelope-related transcriptional attenuator
MTAVLAAFSLQDEIERYGAYAGIAAVFGLGILSLLYFAQAREVKRLREWAGRAPERAAELEARVTADAQRRIAPAPAPTVPRPTAPTTAAAQQGAAPAAPGVAAPATAAAAAAGAAAGATTVAKPGTTAPQNGTGSGAAVPPPGTEAKPGEEKQDGEAAEKPAESGNGEAAKPAEAGAAPASDKPDGAEAKPGEEKPAGDAADKADKAKADEDKADEAKPPVPAATAAAAGAAAAGAGAAAAASPPPAGAAAKPAPGPAPAPAAAASASRPAPLRAPTPSASLPPRTPAGARPRTDGDDGRSRGRIAAIVGASIGVVAVLAVAGILIFGGGGDEPTPKPNTVAQPASDDTGATNGNAATPSKAPVKLDRKAVPLAVLNGTTVTGLARGAADKLTQKGYNEPNVVTNDTTNQARQTSQVFYEAKARQAALDVAKILGVPTSQVKPMDANARALADRAQVAVFVGADKAQ